MGCGYRVVDYLESLFGCKDGWQVDVDDVVVPFDLLVSEQTFEEAGFGQNEDKLVKSIS